MSEFYQDTAYKELRPANLYDVAANETWLEDMAGRGYRLTGFTGWSGVFEEAEPVACRCRMQPLHRKETAPTPEQIEIYRELGWDYAATLRGAFHVWRCEDPKAPELDTDPVVQGMGYGYLKKRMRWDCVGSAVLTAVLLAAGALMPLAFDTPLLDMLEDFAPGELVLRLLVSGLLLALLLCEMRSMCRLLRSLRAGIPLERPRAYRGQKWLARVLAGVATAMCLLMLAGDVKTIDGDSLTRGWDAYDRGGVPKPEVVYADLRTLDGVENDPIFFGVETKVHELAPRMYRVEQSVDVSADMQLAAHTGYYRLLTEGLARELEGELRERFACRQGWEPLEAQSCGSLDALWWSRESGPDGRYGMSHQYAMARLGENVLVLEYRGPTDLRTQGAYFGSLLA